MKKEKTLNKKNIMFMIVIWSLWDSLAFLAIGICFLMNECRDGPIFAMFLVGLFIFSIWAKTLLMISLQNLKSQEI